MLENLTFADHDLSPAELALRELLKKLVIDYDNRMHPLPKIEPRKLVKSLLEQRALKQRDLIPILGRQRHGLRYPLRQTLDQQVSSQEVSRVFSYIGGVLHLAAAGRPGSHA